MEARFLVGAAKERLLLAALALPPGSVIGVDALVDAIWRETAPASARKTLQAYVSNLRRALGERRLDDTITLPRTADAPPARVLAMSGGSLRSRARSSLWTLSESIPSKQHPGPRMGP